MWLAQPTRECRPDFRETQRRQWLSRHDGPTEHARLSDAQWLPYEHEPAATTTTTTADDAAANAS